jgi:NAD-dependent dihydropyrimidine dehydrogenase PreA subunit
MSEDVYKRLAKHLDELPAGYPETESSVELRILRRLFTPEEAELALPTTLIPEEARVIVSTPFNIAHDPETCSGCGLCVSTCPTGSLALVRKPEPEQAHVPDNVLESHKRVGRARGKMGPLSMVRMSIRSKWDRMLAGSGE